MPEQLVPQDPFLVAHWIGQRWFAITGKLSPMSIRDQMLRATAIVDRAFADDLIGSNKSLLVVGAGAGGASAAMRAASLRVPTTLVEQRLLAFTRQGSSHRWVDPTEYDWPAHHWREGNSRWFGEFPETPLWYERCHASQLGGHWRDQLNAFLSTAPGKLLDFQTGTRLLGRPRYYQKARMLEVTLRKAKAEEKLVKRFNMVLDSRGPGSELAIGRYAGFGYWDRDPFEREHLELPEGCVPRVLISGGGDGALQDFLRMIFPGRSPREILGALSDESRALVEREIYYAEDQAQRQYVWGTGAKRDDCIVLGLLQRAHERLVARIFEDKTLRPIREDVCQVLKGAIRPVLDLGNLHLAHKCTHFGRCYPANRFLVVLVDRFLREKGSPSTLQSGLHLAEVNPADGHQCRSDRGWECHGKEHKVVFRAARDCVDLTGDIEHRLYNAIIIRHGVTGRPWPGHTTRILMPRQSLPYYSPWH